MGIAWQVELNPDVTVATDGKRVVIGGVVSVAFDLHEVEFVWSEAPEPVPDPHGQLLLHLKGRPGTLASIRMSRRDAQRVRTMLESGGSRPH